MRLLPRWTFNLAASASVVLAVAVVVLWARSYWVADTLTWGPNRFETTTVTTVPGGFHWRGPSEKTSPIDATLYYWQFLPLTLVVPLWPLVRRWGLRESNRLREIRELSKLAAGVCPSCGYDLRSTPKAPNEGGILLDRCPECGSIPKRA